MAQSHNTEILPEGICSLLDTDLYKLTMQNAALKYFPQTRVTYQFTNRTPDMKFTREGYKWLDHQINKLANIWVSEDEIEYLRKTCTYLSPQYLHYLRDFRLKPREQVVLRFHPENETGSDDDRGAITLHTEGLWVETILYEIPLLALTSEAYFKFCDRNWKYDDQVERAKQKGLRLLEAGCLVSEFGSRRRRDYYTQELVLKGLLQAQDEAQRRGWAGKISGTSNVHFARKFGINPVGTMAHEWLMGVAAITGNYVNATEIALACWVGTFGKGILGIALTDTFGTAVFLDGFRKGVPELTSAVNGQAASLPSAASTTGNPTKSGLATTDPPVDGAADSSLKPTTNGSERFADIFVGVRQDSGDPIQFVKDMRQFYDEAGIESRKTIVFSDSLNVDRCLEYKKVAETHRFQPSFGVGTFLTNDYVSSVDGSPSKPLNIVIKLSSADGNPAVKISDNIGKNTGDKETVEKVKQMLGYKERDWGEGDESKRW